MLELIVYIKQVGESDKMQGLLFRNELNKFNNRGRQMLNSILSCDVKIIL